MRHKRTNSSTKRYNKLTLLVVLIALLAIIAGTLYATNNLGMIGLSRTPTDGQSDVVDYNQPPTEDEAKAGNEIKKEIIKAEEKKDEATAEVVVVDASQYGDIVEVRAFVRGVIQAGTCTATFTSTSDEKSVKVDAFIDATTTQCDDMVLERSELSNAGEWNVVVSYSSTDYTANTESIKLNIE